MTSHDGKHGRNTRLVHAGRHPDENFGILNPPVYHASTITWPSVERMNEAGRRPFDTWTYGRNGTPTTASFEEAVAEMEGGHRAVATPSGLAAIVQALGAFVSAGDHILVADSVYGPTRKYCDRVLRRFGVETTYYDPLIGGGIAELVRDNTRVIFMESPGSSTFEVQDVPAIAAVARERGIATMIDNTWATPLFFRPIEHGVTVSIHAATKYIVGHSDAMMGVAVCDTRETFDTVKTNAQLHGNSAAPDDLYLAQRGLRTMAVRLRQHQESALAVARWLQGRPEVAHVLYPALPEDPGHALWKRDFDGASGLLGVELHPVSADAVAAMADGMSLFPLGASWGGYESLLLPIDLTPYRTVNRWDGRGPLLRLHIGLEDVQDLIADLEAGFDRLVARARAA
ncbi:MAG: cystathionine beta-lyase [Azospirillaceae bacterium]